MLTDAEIDALAIKLLKDAIYRVLSWDSNYFYEVYEMDDGEVVPVYGSMSPEGYGNFVCDAARIAYSKQCGNDCLMFKRFNLFFVQHCK